MDGSERPEKRRKLEEAPDAPEAKNGHTPGSQMTLGERKRKGPRVLVNKINVNHDVIERLRRITKMCGKQVESAKGQKVDVNGSEPTENKEEITNGCHNEKDEEKRLPQVNGSKESDENSEQRIKPIQNGVKHAETLLTENGHKKSEDDDNEDKLQAAADVSLFRQVLKEVIEQRTKIVEEVVAANSIKLQNRIRELERENRELQWNARKVFAAFRQFVIEHEKRKKSRTSQSVQVNIETNLGSDVPASPVIPLPHTITVTKPSHVQVTTAGDMVASMPTTPARPTSLTANTVTSRSDQGLAHSLQKPTVAQSFVQVPANSTAHLPTSAERVAPNVTILPRPSSLTTNANATARLTARLQPKLTDQPAPTAVVYTVKPRPAQLTALQSGKNEQNHAQVTRTNAVETNTSYLQTKAGQSAVSKTFVQPRPIEPRKSLSGSPPDTISPSQKTSSANQKTQLQQSQQRELHQQSRASSHASILPAQRQQPETTASLLQQLQRQQQLQQQHHYERVLKQKQQESAQVRQLLTTPVRSQQEQYQKQRPETSMTSISAPAQRQQDPSSKQRQQFQTNATSLGHLQEKHQLIRSATVPTPQQGNPASSHPMYSLVDRQSHSQPSSAPNLPPSSVPFNATLVNNVLKGDDRSLMNSATNTRVSMVPSRQVTQSHFTSHNQSSVSDARSNTLVQDDINKIAIHPHTVSPAQATASDMKERPGVGGQQSASLQRHETAIHRSSSSQDVSTMQFRKPFPGETFQIRTESATAQRSHSRPPPESFQQQVQHPNIHIQRQERGDTPQPQAASIHRQSTIEAGRGQQVSTDIQQPRRASSTLPTAVVSTFRKLEPKVPGVQQNILVHARRKHTAEDLLPAGYRFSLPSPEYLLERQRLQQAQTQPQNPQISQPSKSQSFQNMPSTVSSGLVRDPKRMVYTMKSPAEGVAAIRTQSALHPKSGSDVLAPSAEIRLTQQKQLELQMKQPGQAHQFQSRAQHVQGKQQVNAPSVTSEGENRRITLQSLYRKPIQSPGISSSVPRSDKHAQDNQSNAAAPTTGNSTNHQQALPKPSASIAAMGKGIVLSWNMEYDEANISIDNYELFACQDVTESNGQPIKWKKIGIVKALPLPMACTLTQFSSGSKYFFSVRAVDEHERAGPFSDPCTVSLTP